MLCRTFLPKRHATPRGRTHQFQKHQIHPNGLSNHGVALVFSWVFSRAYAQVRGLRGSMTKEAEGFFWLFALNGLREPSSDISLGGNRVAQIPRGLGGSNADGGAPLRVCASRWSGRAETRSHMSRRRENHRPVHVGVSRQRVAGRLWSSSIRQQRAGFDMKPGHRSPG